MPNLKFGKHKRGYTLVEFLEVLGILCVVVGSSLLFLTSTLRGTNQANISAEIKQNGQAVLDNLDSQIRNATSVSGDGTGKHIRLERSNADPLHVKCFDPDATTGSEKNGKISTVVSTSGNPLDSTYTDITNSDLISGVDITACSLTVRGASAGTSSPPIVTISFIASQGLKAPSRQDYKASVTFQTTISLRRY